MGGEPESERMDQFEGKALPVDPTNFIYIEACQNGYFDLTPDCGHVTCGIQCDVLIRQVRNRRDTGRDRLVGTGKGRRG